MKVYTLFFGGYSYGHPDPEKDVEIFASLTEAKDTFEDRFHDSFYPCLDNSAEMRVFSGPPLEQECYPDRIIKRGPRGGIVVERVG